MADGKTRKTLSDEDISTRHRRSGPAPDGHGTDVDSDAAAPGDVDTGAQVTRDQDVSAHSDRDS